MIVPREPKLCKEKENVFSSLTDVESFRYLKGLDWVEKWTITLLFKL